MVNINKEQKNEDINKKYDIADLTDYHDFLDVKDVKEILDIGRRQAYRMVKEDDFPAFKIGSVYRIPKIKFCEYIGQKIE